MIDSGASSRFTNPQRARTGFYYLAVLSAAVAVLTLPSVPLVAAVFAVFAVVLAFAGRDSSDAAVTGRWNWLDVLAVLALIGVVYAYGGFASLLGSSPAANAAGSLIIYGGAAAAVGFVVSVRRGARLRDLGWRLPDPFWYLAIPVAVLLANFLSNLVLNIELHTTAFHNAAPTQCTDAQSAYGTNLLGLIVGLPVVSLAAPVVEETLFRGFFYTWLVRLIPADTTVRNLLIGAAMLASALVFGLSHATFGAVYILPLAAVGLILTALYQGSGSLLPGVLTHAIFNAWGLFEILLTKSPC